MRYISAEEFLNQNKEIQQIFLDWWKPEEFDIYVDRELEKHRVTQTDLEDDVCNYYLNTESIPLFTEGQLRKFVEDKTDSKIIVHTSLEDKYHLGFNKYCSERESGDYSGIVYCDDLLQAYWKLACEIAKESIKE